MSVAVVIVAFHSANCIGTCLNALMPQLPVDSEVVVVDNASEDGLAVDPPVRLVTNDINLGYAGGINVGVQETRGISS